MLLDSWDPNPSGTGPSLSDVLVDVLGNVLVGDDLHVDEDLLFDGAVCQDFLGNFQGIPAQFGRFIIRVANHAACGAESRCDS